MYHKCEQLIKRQRLHTLFNLSVKGCVRSLALLQYVSPVFSHEVLSAYFKIPVISLFRAVSVTCDRLFCTWDGTLSKFFPSIRLMCLRACEVIWCLSRKENWQPSRMQWKWLLTWLYLQPAKRKTATVVNSPLAWLICLGLIVRRLRAATVVNAILSVWRCYD